MTKRQITRTRQDLQGLLQTGSSAGSELATAEWGGDVADEASNRSVRDLLALSLIGQKEQRQRILSALERIESGEYGICEECGDPIAEARLKAAPWAATCISCQQEIETAEAEQRRAKRGMD